MDRAKSGPRLHLKYMCQLALDSTTHPETHMISLLTSAGDEHQLPSSEDSCTHPLLCTVPVFHQKGSHSDLAGVHVFPQNVWLR